jgi:hypothetical protein
MNRGSHTVSFERELVHALLQGFLPVDLLHRDSTPPEARLLFRAHHLPRQR